MSTVVESAGIGWVIKWVIGTLFGGGIMLWVKSISSKVSNTYTKEETEKQISSKVVPLEEVVRQNTQAYKELASVMTDVRVELAGLKGRHDGQREDRG